MITCLRWMYAKFSGPCAKCRCLLPAGKLIAYDVQDRKTYCVSCGENLEAERERASA